LTSKWVGEGEKLVRVIESCDTYRFCNMRGLGFTADEVSNNCNTCGLWVQG
jgi:hypothetical protein